MKLDTTKPIELTHQGTLMSGDGRHWKPGKYAPNTVPSELAIEYYGKNFEDDESIDYDPTPSLNDPIPTAPLKVEIVAPKPDVKLEPLPNKPTTPAIDTKSAPVADVSPAKAINPSSATA